MKAWMHKTQNASSEILIMSIIETLVQGCNANWKKKGTTPKQLTMDAHYTTTHL